MIRKYILGLFLVLSVPLMATFAANPALSVTGTGDGNNVNVTVTGGDAGAPVVLYFTSKSTGGLQAVTIGNTGSNGTFTGVLNTTDRNINGAQPVYVLVNGYPSGNVTWPYTNVTSVASGSGLSFSNSSPGITVGQNGTVTISGGSGSYYVSSNGNNAVGTSISGSTLTLNASSPGTSSIIVCSNNGMCGTLNVTASAANTNSVVVNPGAVSLTPGQSGSVVLSGGSAPYTVSAISGNSAYTSLNGTNLTVTSYNGTSGTTTFNVCTSTGACTPLTVNIGQSQNATASAGSPIGLSIPLTVGQTMKLMLSGGSGSYYLPTTYSSPVMASVSGNTVTVLGAAEGSNTLSVCSTSTACVPVTFLVSGSANTLTGTGGKFYFQNTLAAGVNGNDVTELQTRLQGEGYYSGPITGYFGPLTLAAVKAYQSAKGLPSTGYVGTMTMASFNKDF